MNRRELSVKRAERIRRIIWTFLPPIALMCFGIYLVIQQPQKKLFDDMVAQQAELIEGRSLYENLWINLDLYFRIYLFDVENPDDVMVGGTPQLKEHGPYVYDMNLKKNVLSVDEKTDEITFTTTRTYRFNKDLSGGSENDQITIVNSAYVGTIATMAKQFPAFIKKLGNDIEKLYPGMENLFITARAGDILFDGLPMACDPKEYPELKLICGFLMGKKPPGIRDTNVEGVYAWSFFEKLNGTVQGPMSVNRGVIEKKKLGDTTSFKGKRKQRLWKGDNCNRVFGTDSMTWPPMEEKLDEVTTFEPQVCRKVLWRPAYFVKDEIINGLIGWKYRVKGRAWEEEENVCYCPINKASKQPECPTTGLMDITACQEIPIYYSEPHFLFGDPLLRDYAKGTSPDIDKHASFITIEPLTGAPLHGSKKMQLNAKIVKTSAVKMLANVTDGYLPVLWAEESAESTVEAVKDVLQAHRMARLLRYLTYVPLILGSFLTINAAFLYSDNNDPSDVKIHVNELILSTHSILIRNRKTKNHRRSIDNRRSITNRSRLVRNDTQHFE